jgi:hypothetical protein
MTIEETIFNLTDSANELYSYGEYAETIKLFQIIDSLCDSNNIDMPDEAIRLNIELDSRFIIDATIIDHKLIPAVIRLSKKN